VTLRVIVFALLLLLVIRAIRLLIAGIRDGAASDGGRREASAVKLVRDPVCGTHVPPRTALSATSGGATYYFCSDECRRKFKGGR
jgi:YHS domain-containing protein